jgi:hypothetical protein
MKTPDEEVAIRILEELRKRGLLSDSGLTKLGPRLASGQLSAEDWRLAVEIDRSDKERKE